MQNKPLRVSAILMAAGASRRMGRDKLLLPFGEGTLLSHALALLLRLPVDQKLLVATPHRLRGLRLPPGITAVANPCPEKGQSESLRLGVANATGDAYLFLTGDQPLLGETEVCRLLAHADREHIVFPVVAGKPRSPSIFPACFRQELLEQRGDQGGRSVRANHPQALRPLAMENPLPFEDIDTMEDYIALLKDGRATNTFL